MEPERCNSITEAQATPKDEPDGEVGDEKRGEIHWREGHHVTVADLLPSFWKGCR